MTKLARAANTKTAQAAYIAALAAKYAEDPELKHYSPKTRQDFARRTILGCWPNVERQLCNVQGVWRYEVTGGYLAPELSGALGADWNLHVGPEATLATGGLIGISGAAIADDIGGTLLDVIPVSYRTWLKPGEVVEIEITYLKRDKLYQYFEMTGLIRGRKGNNRLFKKAEIKMSGAKTPGLEGST